VETFALELHVDVVEMVNTTADDLQTLSLVDAVQPRQPVEQLRTEPTFTLLKVSNISRLYDIKKH